MNLFYLFKLYLVTFAAFFTIDMLWLGLVARKFYRQQIGFLLSPNPNWTAAILFYLIFIAGILVFAVLPGLLSGSLRKAVLLGAFLGLLTYSTYDLTNLATVKDWPLSLTIVDMIWGIFLASSVTFIGYLAGRWLVKENNNV